jgi:Ser/Thr protein kinase RdoA (MazF antagonist)
MAHELVIPADIQKAYAIRPETVRVIASGMINRTIIVDGGGAGVFQRLAKDFDEDQTADCLAVTRHLQSEGWEVPSLLQTVDGDVTRRDEKGHLWRGFEFIDSDESTDGFEIPELNASRGMQYGLLLARLHRSLGTLDYEPTFSLDHFHEIDFSARVLQSNKEHIPSESGVELAEILLEKYEGLEKLPDGHDQLIHGDPRTANILHRDGDPFTFIDWDTLMQGTIWMDMGDMLRSLSEDAVEAGRPIPIDVIERVAKGYREAMFPDYEEREFRNVALLSAQTIAVELGMRFIADYDDDDPYFKDDSGNYATQHKFTSEKVQTQLEIYNQLKLARGEQL